MAIVVQHQPSLEGMAEAAYYGGLGNFNQRQQALQLQYAQMANQRAAQERALQANLYSQGRAQAFNAQQAGADRAFRAGMFGADMARDAEMLRARRAWEVEDRDLGLAAADARMRAGFDADREAMAERARLAADADARQAAMWAARDRENWLAAGLKGGQLYYTPAQKQSLNNLRGAMHALNTSPDFTPEDREAEMQSLQEQYDAIRMNPFEKMPDEMPPSTEEAVRSKTVWMVGPDGKNRQYQVQVRNGVEQVDVVAEEETEEDRLAQFAASFRGKTKKDVAGNVHEYTAEDIHRQWKVEQDALALMQGGKQEPSDPQTGKAKFGGGMQLPDAGIQPPPPPAPPGQRQPPPAPPGEVPVGQDGIPRPRTPQEAASLPPGTFFITPDGRKKVVPNG